LFELLKTPEGPVDLVFEKKLQIELHQRLLMPLTSLSFILIVMGFFLRGDYDRRGRPKRVLAAVVCCAVVEVGTLGLLNLGLRSLLFVALSYALVFGSALLGFLYLGQERVAFNKRPKESYVALKKSVARKVTTKISTKGETKI
jgi:lipopolysaccharide export system permease protein